MRRILLVIILLVGMIGVNGFAQSKQKQKTIAAGDETLTNTTIIDLHKAGLDDDLIIAKINSTAIKADLSTDKIIELKKAGISNAVVKAMLDKSNGAAPVAASPVKATATPIMTNGSPPAVDMVNTPVYFDKTAGKAVPLEFQTAKAKLKLSPLMIVPGVASPVNLRAESPKSPIRLGSTAPTFIINCTTSTTPDAVFGLYRFSNIKSSYRETLWQKVSGISTNQDKDMIGFNYRKLSDGIFEIIPNKPLDKGEYCFINRISYANYKEMKADIFAFGID